MAGLCGLERKETGAKRRLVRRAIFPKLAPGLSVYAQAFVVRHAVLHDQRFHALWMRQCHPKTDRHAVVLHVKGITREPKRFGEMIHDFRDMTERVRRFLDPASHCDRTPGNLARSNDIGPQVAQTAAQTFATKKEVHAAAKVVNS